MNEMTNKTAVGTADSGRLYIEDLLSRYPAIAEAEKLAILDFLNKSSALDSALLTCNEAIAENLKAFRQDNRKQLGFTPVNWLIMASILVSVAFAIYYMWDAGT
jgi:hypothetical protein